MRNRDESADSKIANIASRIGDGTVDFIEGIRRLAALVHRFDLQDDSHFHPILAVESEIEDLPTGKARELWEPEALKRKEEQVAAYLEAVKETVLDACRKIAIDHRP